MIAFKQLLLSSDTQLQPGTSSDSKSTMMDRLAKTADQRRSKVRRGSHKARPITGDGFSSRRGVEMLPHWELNYVINDRGFTRWLKKKKKVGNI